MAKLKVTRRKTWALPFLKKMRKPITIKSLDMKIGLVVIFVFVVPIIFYYIGAELEAMSWRPTFTDKDGASYGLHCESIDMVNRCYFVSVFSTD